MKKTEIKPLFLRKFPDPINREDMSGEYDIEHILAICQANQLPDGIPLGPNPRAQNTDKTIYKKVKESLEAEEDPTFFLKNKGITILARKLVISDDKKTITVFFDEQDGIVDGGHTYRIIQDSVEKTPDNQYVKIEIITGLPDYFIEPIAEGLNTAVQVQQMSLSNLSKKFDWIKEAIADKHYASSIAWKENEEGKFDARDIVALMTLFNIDLYPEMTNEHPRTAYISKAKCLSDYLDPKKMKTFKKMIPILDDILKLHDYVQTRSNALYNKKYKGKGAALAFFRNRKRGKYQFIFLNEESKHQLYDGALYPILAALRFLVEKDKETGLYKWKVGSIEDVKKFYDKIGAELIKITKNTSDSKGKNPNAIGKDENHWAYLYKTVALELVIPLD